MKNLIKLFTIIAVSALTIYSCKDDEDVKVAGITLDKDSTSTRVGGTVALAPSIQPVDASSKEITWSSKDATIATVANGTVTGVAIGTTWIVAVTTDGGYKDSCKIVVEPAAGATITLSQEVKSNITLKADVNYILDGWVYVRDGATITIEPGTVIKGKTGTK
ncbi:MAG TPA: Ig-like domain-containing protein, partial [Bacteroidales bacterium]|nr:Ig-like domain-containing protein [Bacteroidales bacterium]